MDENRSSGSQQQGPGSQGIPGQQRGPGTLGGGQSEGLYEQAQGAVRDAASGASEMWDDAYEQGERYYRQGADALRNVESTTLGALLVAGAIGYAVSWLIHGQDSRLGQNTRSQRQVGYSGRDERDHRGQSRR